MAVWSVTVACVTAGDIVTLEEGSPHLAYGIQIMASKKEAA